VAITWRWHWIQLKRRRSMNSMPCPCPFPCVSAAGFTLFHSFLPSSTPPSPPSCQLVPSSAHRRMLNQRRSTSLLSFSTFASLLTSALGAYVPLREYAGESFFDNWDYYGGIDNTTWGECAMSMRLGGNVLFILPT
jgi:hypothetical protein